MSRPARDLRRAAHSAYPAALLVYGPGPMPQSPETDPEVRLEDVNSAIHEAETGQVKARLVFDLQ